MLQDVVCTHTSPDPQGYIMYLLGWTETCCVDQSEFELEVLLLPLPPEC